jgi:hypothetical protein
MVRIEPREIVLAARGAGRLLRLCAVGALLHLGCTLITDVDRTKIPQPPPFLPEGDAGELPPEPETDAGVVADAAPEPEDGSTDPGPDAAPSGNGGL